MVFSDWYHYNKDGEYKETRIVSDDFEGKSLFLDFTDAQWNDTFNFFAQCLQFYLGQNQKFDPPMENVTKRNLLKEMGDQFHSWADSFFSIKKDNGEFMNLDTEVPKNEAFERFMKEANMSRMTANSFKKRLQSYAKYNSWIYNPKELANDGRIMKKINGKTEEHFFIKTKKKVPEAVAEIQVQHSSPAIEMTDEDFNELDM